MEVLLPVSYRRSFSITQGHRRRIELPTIAVVFSKWWSIAHGVLGIVVVTGFRAFGSHQYPEAYGHNLVPDADLVGIDILIDRIIVVSVDTKLKLQIFNTYD